MLQNSKSIKRKSYTIKYKLFALKLLVEKNQNEIKNKNKIVHKYVMLEQMINNLVKNKDEFNDDCIVIEKYQIGQKNMFPGK